MLSIVTLPSASTFLSDISAWSTPLFNDLYPIASWAIGIMLAVMVIVLMIRLIAYAMNRVMKKE